MKFLLMFFGSLVSIFGLSACKVVESAMIFDNKDPVVIHSSNMQAVPSKRTLTKVGRLGADQVAMLRALIGDAKRQKMGFVSPRYFLSNNKKVVGVVISSSGEFIGFDVTTDDASSVPATTTHDILVPRNKVEAKRFIEALNTLVKD